MFSAKTDTSQRPPNDRFGFCNYEADVIDVSATLWTSLLWYDVHMLTV